MKRFYGAFGWTMTIDEETVARAHQLLLQEAAGITELVNRARQYYRQVFTTEITPVEPCQVRAAIDDLFADTPRALNLACLLGVAFSLHGREDYEVFIVDELLGAAIADLIAGGEPNRTFARANFHVLDVVLKPALRECFGPGDDRQLAVDDALAGLAAGFEAILPGWDWMDRRRKVLPSGQEPSPRH